MIPEGLVAALHQRGYQRRVTREPGWLDRTGCPGGGFVRVTFNDAGSVTATRMDRSGFRMSPVTEFPAGESPEWIIEVLAELEQMTEQEDR